MNTTVRSAAGPALALALALALSACGSTVQQQSLQPGGAGVDQGLGGSAVQGGVAAPLAGDAGPGAAVDGSTDTTGGAPVTGSAAQGPGTSGGTSRGVPRQGASTGSAAPSAGEAPATGPRVTSPVKIGFLNTKVGNAGAAGLNTGETVSPATVFKALVKGVNAKGGLSGRRVVPVTADTDTASGDWNTDYSAACQKMTRDDPVSVIVGYSFTFLDSFEACLAKAGVPHLSGGYSLGDEKVLRDYPGLVATNAPTADRRFRLQAEGAVREGYLTRANKLGVVVDGCASSLRALKNGLDPYLASVGLKEESRVQFNCPSGAGDVGTAASQVQAAVLRFRQLGVDRVFIEGIPIVLFAQAAESQGYRPGYVVTSTSNGTSLEPNMPEEQLVNVHGYGWMPHMDVTRTKQPAQTGAQKTCLSLLKTGGVVPTGFNDFLQAYAACDGLFLYGAALERTGGRTEAAAVLSAISALGTSQPGSGLYEGRSDYRRRNAPAVYRPWRYGTDCSCFAYSGPSQPMP